MEGDNRSRSNAHKTVISIHALRVEGDPSIDVLLVGRRISIHALRVEGDVILVLVNFVDRAISIHALRVEGDPASV